jgi:hypothetical protein
MYYIVLVLHISASVNLQRSCMQSLSGALSNATPASSAPHVYRARVVLKVAITFNSACTLPPYTQVCQSRDSNAAALDCKVQTQHSKRP